MSTHEITAGQDRRTVADMTGDYMCRWMTATDAKRELESQVNELTHRVVTLEVALEFKKRECERLKTRLALSGLNGRKSTADDLSALKEV